MKFAAVTCLVTMAVACFQVSAQCPAVWCPGCPHSAVCMLCAGSSLGRSLHFLTVVVCMLPLQVALVVPGASPVHKATIVPRGHALGMVTQVRLRRGGGGGAGSQQP